MEKKRLLLIEDDPISIEVIVKFLSRDYFVVTALNGPEGILKAKKEIFDIVLLDIQLPLGMNGIEVLKQLRLIRGYQNIPIIAQTAYSMEDDKKKILDSGFDAYISKPYLKSDILKIIDGF